MGDEPAQDGALTKKRSAQSAELPEEEESSSESESSEEEKKRKAKEKKKKKKKLGYGEYSQMMVMNQMMGMSMIMNNPLAMSMMNNPKQPAHLMPEGPRLKVLLRQQRRSVERTQV